MAAAAESHEHVPHAFDPDAQIALLPRYDAEKPLQSSFRLLFSIVKLFRGNEFKQDLARREPAVADARQQSFLILHAQLLGDRLDLAFAPERGVFEFVPAEIALQDLPSERDASFSLLLFEPVADVRFRPRSFGKLQPIPARRLLMHGDDLDRVAAAQQVTERNELAVDARARAVMPHLRVDPVSEIDHRGALGKIEQVSLGRKDVDRVGKQVLFNAVEKLLRILQVLLPFEELAQPGESLHVVELKIFDFFLVAPMGRDAFFRHPMHVLCADLDFHALAVRPDHRRVQRLIHIGLRQRDVIFEAPGHGLPLRVDHPERLVALSDGVYQNAERDEIVNLIVEKVLRLHLLIDAVEVFGSAGHFGLDAFFFEDLADERDHLVDVFLPRGFLFRHVALELIINLRMEMLEREVLQLVLDPGDAETMGERGVDVERLLRRGELLLHRHMVESPHVVRAVGKLD